VILLTLGPAGGASQLPGQEDIATAELTSQIKGRDMLIDRYADLLHVER
jgi:apoptosis-inducing factor 2